MLGSFFIKQATKEGAYVCQKRTNSFNLDSRALDSPVAGG